MEKAKIAIYVVAIAFVGSFIYLIIRLIKSMSCNDSKANNYGKREKCTYTAKCEDDQALNFEESGECTYPVICEDTRATNQGDEGTCIYAEGCPYGNALNYNEDAGEANGSCIFVNNDNDCTTQEIIAAKYKLADAIGITPGELDGWLANFFESYTNFDRSQSFIDNETIRDPMLTNRQIASYMAALMIFNFECTGLEHIMSTVGELEVELSTKSVQEVASQTFL